jgi:hypothetical protein
MIGSFVYFQTKQNSSSKLDREKYNTQYRQERLSMENLTCK